MIRGNRVLLLVICLLVIFDRVNAQEEKKKKWSVTLFTGFSRLQDPQTVPYKGNIVTTYDSDESYCLPAPIGFDVEFYIPHKPFSIKASVFDTEMIDGDDYMSTTTMLNIGCGGRYRPAPQKWLLQPYVGFDAGFNVGKRKIDIKREGTCDNLSFHDAGSYSLPWLSLGPVVGCDFFITHSIAMQLELGYRFGIGGKTSYTTDYEGRLYSSEGNMNRVYFSMGYKIVFPWQYFGFFRQQPKVKK